ncbi:MAG: hypothetical protein KDA28_05820 [Phycisphaerales bacterium]|nr:hypothetical protein [Phycisphaerales bacterium]
MHEMRHPGFSILLAVLVLLQSVLGPLGTGPIAFCLGGGHTHTPDEVASACDRACDHGEVVGTPVPSEDHDCDCRDVEFTVVSLPATLRVSDDLVLAMPVPVFMFADMVEASEPRLMPRPNEDPGGGVLDAMRRCTRLLL